jgi:hypothetical protein
MNEQEIITGAVTTLISAVIGLIIRHFEKKKLKKENKLVD